MKGDRKEPSNRQRLVDVDVSVHALKVGDMRFNSFFGRAQNVVLELAAMEDYLISRSQSVPLDHATDREPERSASKPSESQPPLPQPPLVRSFFKFGVASGGPDHHFTAVARCEPGLELVFHTVVRVEGRYAFTACYVVAKPPLFPAPGVMNCYRLRCVSLPDELDLPAFTESMVKDEVWAFGKDRRGPQQPTMEGLEHVAVAFERDVDKGVGRVTHDYRSKKITVEIDVEKATESDRLVHEALRDVVGKEVLSFLPRPRRGPSPAVDRTQLRSMYRTILAASQQLLAEFKSWPPVNRESTAVMLAQQRFRLSTQHATQVGPFLRKGLRRPQPKSLAIRVLSVVSGYSQRHLYDLIGK